MKNKASAFLKQIVALLSSISKAKSMVAEVKSKTSSMKARLAMLSLFMKNKKAALFDPISDKTKSLAQLGHHRADDGDDDYGGGDPTKLAIVLYNSGSNAAATNQHLCCWSPSSSQPQLYLPPPHPLLQGQGQGDDDNDGGDDKYPDLTHKLFNDNDYYWDMSYLDDDNDGDNDGNGSVIDIVRNSKAHGGGEFKLEDEIDQVADLFITRFHKQIRMQKLQSFKRYQEMLNRSL